MDIRDATPNDIEGIADIYCHYIRTSICTLEEHKPSLDAIRDEFSKIFAIGTPFIVAIDSSNGGVTGYSYAGPFNERSGYNATCEDSIYVHHDYCGRKLGKELLQSILDRLKASSKITQVIAKMSILPEQAPVDLPSCRLHMSFGFKLVGRLYKVGRKFEKWIDVLIMQLDMSSTS